MVTPASIGDFVTQAFDSNVLTAIMDVTTKLVTGILVVAFFVAIFILMQFKYKIYYYEAKGLKDSELDGSKPIQLLGKRKKDLARPIKKNGVDKWQLLKARKYIEPVQYKYIGAKNIVWMLRTGPSAFIPAIHNTNFVVGNHVIESLMPLQTDIKFWEQMGIKQTALETVPEGYHKQIVKWITIWVIILLIFTAAITWINLQASQQAIAHIDIVGAAVDKIANIAGPG